MMLIPKIPRENKKRLKYIRSLPCLICGAPPPSEAAHIRMGLAGGMGLKPKDTSTVPLCHEHHRIQHKGERTFWIAWLPKVLHMLAEKL